MSKENLKVGIKVHIPEIILNENPEVMKVYNQETESITYDIDADIPKEFIDKLELLVPQFHGSDVVVFNPLIGLINQLQQIKNVKYNPNDYEASDRLYIDNNKIIGAFNSSLTKIKKTMKDPQIAKNKMIDAIFEIFETESKNTRGALEESFKPLLLERERITKEKDDAKKTKELEAIAALSETNTKLEEQISNQTKATALTTVENALNSVLINVAIQIPNLNKEGLETLKENLSLIQFNMYVDPVVQNSFDHIELDAFQKRFVENKKAAISNVEMALNALSVQQTNVELESKNAVLEAQIPGPLDVIKMEVMQPEFIGRAEEPNFGAISIDSMNDAQKFNFITNAQNRILIDYKQMIEDAKVFQFADPQFAQLRDKLTDDQFPKILEWLEKLAAFCNKKQEIINEHFKN